MAGMRAGAVVLITSKDAASRSTDCDVLIVGAGAVGLSLGVKLARSGIRVTIVEAGAAEPNVNYQMLNHGVVVGRAHHGLRNGRMKALGGTTRLWGGQLVPFGEFDLEGDRITGRPAWPVTYAELRPFFEEAFAFLGIRGLGADQEAIWRKVTGLSTSFGDQLRLGMNIWLPQPDFARLFAAEIAGNENLTVITGAEANSLLLDSKGSRIEGVEAGQDGEMVRLRAKRTVLANGTFEIVRLLLRTAALAPRSGFATNPNIGRGFVDHLHGPGGLIKTQRPRELGRSFDNIHYEGRKYTVKIRMEDSFRRQRSIGNCVGTINAAANLGTLARDLRGLIRRIVGGDGAGSRFREAFGLARILAPMAWRYVVARRSASVFSDTVSLGLEIEQLPAAESYILLDPGEPPETAPVQLHWNLSGQEMEAVTSFCDAFKREFESRDLGVVTIDPRIVAADPSFLLDCHDANHHIGGARMGGDADTGVVDANLRVFGMDNLFVLGAAVFPSGSFANPTLTAIAFAMRLANHLVNARAGTPPTC